MKFLIVISLFTLTSFATQDQEQRIKNLELRVERLEKQLSSKSSLKVKDYNQGQAKKTMSSRPTSQKTAPAMSDKQRKEMEDAIKAYKDKQIEHQKALEELMEQP